MPSAAMPGHPGHPGETRARGARAARRRRLRHRRPREEERAAAAPSAVVPDPGPARHFCYALFDESNERGGRTYVGYTVDPPRRLRQHNGELCGGANRTRCGRPPGGWSQLFVVTAETEAFGAHEGLSLEWHLKRGGPPTLRGVARRLSALRAALDHPKFARFLERLVVFVAPRYVDAAWAALSDLPTPHGCCVLPLDRMA